MSNARPPGTPRVHCRKQSMYFPEQILNEIEVEARRTGLSFSKLVQHAWAFAREKVRALPPTK